eukprot:m.92966 g.92966  ORF g.92966 m.92966 type:complete len:1128 (-) comp8525_c1_seq1:83-3466(-)
MATKPPLKSALRPAGAAPKKPDTMTKFKAVAAAAVAASVGAPPGSPGSEPKSGDAGARAKVSRYVDPKVAARNSALNAMGGVKVDVFVRVRPKGAVDGDDAIITTIDPENSQITLEDVTGHPAKYTYDKVYGMDSTQEELYEDCVAPIVEQVCRGLSCAIFAYGQTGAGKTYTMRGDLSGDESKHGVIQRSVIHLFRRLQEHDYSEVKVSTSFLEIYNEELEDLYIDRAKETKPGPGKKPAQAAGKQLMLVDDPDRGCVCSGLTELPVATLEEVMKLLQEAEARCRFSETKMNKMSNRAHRIFTLIVNFKRYDNPISATLTFVDLAGSEDISKSGAKGLTAREASHINKSLLTLGRVINALACNEKHIPYRDSKLTRLLSEALGGVCKTSFIACVSPTGTSATETNSTLRYAERAMEALNISQLPRWKQDEIMIDGLTRRVQQLLDEMDLRDRIHHEEMTELKNDKIALTAENGQLKKDLRHAERKIGRLVARKQQLRSGIRLLTQQRDVLTAQREALQTELLETRSVRDGYLTDRSNLAVVLTSVRAMRERLLKAHTETEGALTRDANHLKRAIEGAIVDIDDLHAEVLRKKGLSQHNEKLADDFKDRISARLRGLVENVTEFKAGQDDAFSTVAEMLSGLKSDRQRENSSLRSDVSRLNSNIASALSEISQFAKDTDTALKARLARNRETCESNRDDIEVGMSKLKGMVVAKLEELRVHSATLDDNLTAWADKMKTRMEETLASSQRFSKDVLGNISSLQAHLEGATTAQLQHLQEHSAALQKHYETERATITSESDRVIADISAYVQRILHDHSTQAIRRTEKAINGFTATTASIADETKEMVAHQISEHTAMTNRNAEWIGSTGRSIDEGLRNNNAAHLTAAGLVKKTVATSQAAESELGAGVTAVNALAAQQRDGHLQFCKDADMASTGATAKLDGMTAKGASEHHADSERLRETIQGHADKFDADSGELAAHTTAIHESMREHVETHTDHVFEAEEMSVRYVMQEIKRDPKEPAKRKEYVYPTAYQATEAYPALLQDVAADWKREEQIRDGKIAAGEGPDFPGKRGPEDHSGLLTSTKPKPMQPQDQQALDTAARESDAGEYTSDGEHDEEEGEADGEASL